MYKKKAKKRNNEWELPYLFSAYQAHLCELLKKNRDAWSWFIYTRLNNFIWLSFFISSFV